MNEGESAVATYESEVVTSNRSYVETPLLASDPETPIYPENLTNPEIKNTIEIEQIVGFKPNEQELIKATINSLGFYTGGITTVETIPNRRSPDGDLMGNFTFPTGVMGLTKDCLNRPIEGIRETIIHEGAHAASPFWSPKARDYYLGTKGAEVLEQATEAIRSFAYQTYETEIYLNGYHKWLFQTYGYDENGNAYDEIPPILLEETQAILTEIALTDANKLLQVREAQLSKRERNGYSRAESVDLLDVRDRHLALMIADVETEKIVEGKNVALTSAELRSNVEAKLAKINEMKEKQREQYMIGELEKFREVQLTTIQYFGGLQSTSPDISAADQFEKYKELFGLIKKVPSLRTKIQRLTGENGWNLEGLNVEYLLGLVLES